MLRFALPMALLLLGACATAPRQASPAPSGQVQHVSLLAGAREFQDNDLETLELESQTAFGVEYDTYDAGSGSGFEVGYSQSSDDSSFPGINVELDVQELYVGFRQTFMPERNVHPYAGLGVSYLRAEVDANVLPSADDNDLAPYLHAGVLWDVADRWRLGADFRMVFANFDGTDGDYQQLALSLGFRF